MTVAHIVATAGRRFGAATALQDEYRTVSYADLAARTQQLAHGLRNRVHVRSSTVMVLMTNSAAAIEVDLALAIAGLVRVSLNPRLRPGEWDAIRRDCRPAALIVDATIEGALDWALRTGVPTYVALADAENGDPPSLEAIIAEAPPVGPELPSPEPFSLCALHYSSGTTGVPKGAQRSHANRLTSVDAMRRYVLNPTLHPDDPPIFLHAGPVIHTSGLFVLPIIELGGMQILLEHPGPDEIIDAVGAHDVTHTALVPTVIARLLEFDDETLAPLHRLRMLAYAGAPMSVEHARQAFRRITPNLVQYYGMVEAIPPLTVLDAAAHRRGMTDEPHLLRSAGTVCEHVHISVCGDGGPVPDGETGELVVSGSAVGPGYHDPGGRDDLGKSHRDGCLHTGDRGFVSSDGFVYLTGRSKDMIITGGYNVYPREVENVIAATDGINDVVVVGLPDSVWGQRIVAAYTTTAPSLITEDQILERARLRLSDFKRPKAVYRLDALPVTALGKIDRAAALRMIAEQIAADRLLDARGPETPP